MSDIFDAIENKTDIFDKIAPEKEGLLSRIATSAKSLASEAPSAMFGPESPIVQTGKKAVGLGENILSMVTGLPGFVAGGITQGGEAVVPGSAKDRGLLALAQLLQSPYVTYQPHTEEGQKIAGTLATPVELARAKGPEVADWVTQKTGSPLLGTVAGTVVAGAPEVAMGIMGLRSGLARPKPSYRVPGGKLPKGTWEQFKGEDIPQMEVPPELQVPALPPGQGFQLVEPPPKTILRQGPPPTGIGVDISPTGEPIYPPGIKPVTRPLPLTETQKLQAPVVTAEGKTVGEKKGLEVRKAELKATEPLVAKTTRELSDWIESNDLKEKIGIKGDIADWINDQTSRTKMEGVREPLTEPLPTKAGEVGVKQPWEMTKEEFAANPPEGFVYKQGRGYSAQRDNKVTNISDSFFDLAPTERKVLLNHETGHDLVRDFNKDFKDVFEPLKKGFGKDSYGQNREIYENPFGFRENPEEIIADTYASLFEPFPYEKGGKYDALRQRVAAVAIREGKPVPPVQTVPAPSEVVGPEVIVDFNGRDKLGPVALRAEWDGKKVTFSDDWEGVPDMPTEKVPSESEVYAWAKKHEPVPGVPKVEGVPEPTSRLPAPSDVIAKDVAYETRREALQRLTSLRETKPHSETRRFGKNGPTPEQKVAYDTEVREWNKQYREANKAFKESDVPVMSEGTPLMKAAQTAEQEKVQPKLGLLKSEKGTIQIPPDVVEGVKTASGNLKSAWDGIKRLVNPTGRGEKALDMGQIISEAQSRNTRFHDQLDVSLGEFEKTFNKMPQKDKYGFAGRMSRGELQSDVTLQKIADSLEDIFKDRAAMVNKVDPTALRTLRENYFPGIWKDKAPTLGGTLSKRPLEGSKSFLKPKVFDDWEEAIKAGFEPASDNPIVLAKMKIAEMDKYILAHTVLNEGKQAGLVSFLRSGDKMPDGWTRINDPIGTVYGPPNIAVKEYIDKRVYDSLLGVANSLGIKHERLPNAGRGKIGYSVQGANKIVTQHATETSVLAHEIGHQLDVKYDLWDNLLKRDSGKGFQPGRSELRAIADLTERGQKARTGPEKIAQVIEAYVHSPEEMEQVAPRVFTWFDKFVKETPELKPLSEIKPGIALKTLETNIPTGGFPVVGNYIAPEEVAQVVNNYISQPLSSNKYFGSLYRGYMNAAGLLNQFQLTGPFHGGFTTAESIISRQALAAKQLYRVFTGKEDPATFLKTALTSPAAFIEKSLKGKKIQQEWLKPGTHPEYGQTVEDIHLAGGGIRRDEFLRADYLKQFLEAVREGKPGTAIWKSPGAATELMAKPIMEWYVPKLKMGAFDELATEYRKVFPNLTEQEYGRAMRQIWNRVDSRLGQVLYDRTFMNNAAKQVVQGLIRAPGWSGGTIAEIGGAPKDAVNFFRQWAKEGKPPQELPDRVAYVISLAATTAVTNGALTYLLTGDMPKGTDFMAFRTGVTTPDGNPERGMLPTYSKDVYAYKQSPIRTLAHKTNPLIGLGLDISRNKDYYGVQVYNPEGTIGEKIGDVGKYILKAFTPFFLRGIQKNREEKSDIPRTLLPLVGVMPAPSHLTQTSAQQKAGEIISGYMPQRARTQEEFERNKLVKQYSHDIKETIQKKQPIREYVSKIAADLRAGKLNDKDIEKIEERIGTAPLERNVTRMKLQDALRVWDVASLEEKRKLKQIILDKVDRFDGTEEEVKALVPKIKAVINQ